MSLKKLTASLDASISLQRNTHKPSCSHNDHIIDFQMEILDKLYPNFEIEYGAKQHLLHNDSNELEQIKSDISNIWHKYKPLIKKITLWRHSILISMLSILSLIIANVTAYFIFIENDIDTQNDNSCSLFTVIYELCLLIIAGFPLIYLRITSYHRGLTRKWRNHFRNNMVILINNKLSKKYSSQQWIFELIYPVKVQKPKKYPQCWCYLRITANVAHTQQAKTDKKQPVYATSKIYDGEIHLVMDFDLYLNDEILAINIINGKKRGEYNYENVVSEIGEFIMDLRIKYKTCILRLSLLLLIIICLVMLFIPWFVCSGYVTGKTTVDNKNFNTEIYLIVGVSVVCAISFVIVAFCTRKWLFRLRKRNYINKLKQFMSNVLSVSYPNYAYSIVCREKDNMWCQLRISDHVLKCRADDRVLHTTYNDKTSVSIRNKSFGNEYCPKSPLVQ